MRTLKLREVCAGWRTAKGVVLGAAVSLGGCMVGPDFERPQVAVPTNWRTTGDPRIATQTAADSLWWKGFNDPSLDRLIELAYRQNLSLQIAGLRIVEARARLGIATGRQLPQIQQVFASGTALGLSENGTTPALVDRHFFDYQLGFDAAWELDFWGKYRRGVEAEAAALLASVGDYYAALISLNAEVARTYIVIRTFEVLIEQGEANVRLQTAGFDIADSRFRNGATSELDPVQAKTLLESTRASIPPLRTGLQQAMNALATLLGQSPGTIDALLAGPKQIPRAPAKVAVGVPAEMLRRRPDIRSAEFFAAAQCARIGVAKAELYPSFSLVGTIGLDASTRQGASRNLFSPSSLFYSVGPQINWSVLNYGRIKNAVRVEDARFQQLLIAYHDTVLRAAQEVEDALSGFVNSQQALAFEQAAVAAATRSVEIAGTEYREGEADYQRVLDAQRSLLERQNSLAQTSSDVVTSLVALYKALGGGWEFRQGQPVVHEDVQRQMKERTDWGDMLSEPRSQETTGSQPPRRQ